MVGHTHTKKQGFTVVELLVVVVVIAILAALVIVSYNGIQQSARDKAVLSDVSAVESALVTYSIKHGGSYGAALVWYSEGAANENIGFTPSNDNVVDVVADAAGYCIRAYNTGSATYKSIFTAAQKEGKAGDCSRLSASTEAIADSFTPNGGNVTTLAGSGSSGSTNGQGTAATFATPGAMALDSSGTLYVAEATNYRIRKITPNGTVTTFVGSGTSGSADGTGTAAQFGQIYGLTFDGDGNLVVSDAGNNRIRKVTPAGVVTTFAGSTYGYTDATGTAAQFRSPGGIVFNPFNSNLYVTDTAGTIRQITPAGVVSTYTGSPFSYGPVDGSLSSARFSIASAATPLAIDASGNMYVAANTHVIRKISASGTVSTLAGSTTSGYVNANGTSARFNTIYGMAVDLGGNVFVTEYSNRIRKVTQLGDVTTFAGTGAAGTADGSSTTATFNQPYGISINSENTMYVSDMSGRKIRKIQ